MISKKCPQPSRRSRKNLLEQEASGDRARTDAWFKKYGTMPPELSALLAKTSEIPVDVDPEFDFRPAVEVDAGFVEVL